MLLTFFLMGCASQALRVESNPDGAEVYLLDDNGTQKLLGVTPLSVNEGSVLGLFKNNLQLRVYKKNYEAEVFIVPSTSFPASGRLSINLKENPDIRACREPLSAYNEIARGVAEIQFNTAKKNYLNALNLVQSMSGKYPNVSVFYDLSGNIYYLMRDFDKALTSYQRSLELFAGNPETQRMIDKLNVIHRVGGAPAAPVSAPIAPAAVAVPVAPAAVAVPAVPAPPAAANPQGGVEGVKP